MGNSAWNNPFDAKTRIKGWIQYNGTGTVAIQDSFNVSGLNDVGVGHQEVVWDTDFANNDYSAVATAYDFLIACIDTITTTHVRILTRDPRDVSVADSAIVTVIAIGDQ